MDLSPKKKYKRTAAIALAALSLLAAAPLTGCGMDMLSGSSGPKTIAAERDVRARDSVPETPSSPQETYDNPSPPARTPAIGAESDGKPSGVEKTAPAPNGTAVKKQPSEGVWSADAPKLLDLAVGDARSTVQKLYGKPFDSYAMEDEDGMLTVLEYRGFSVGLNDAGRVAFVEVYGPGSGTGIGGLKIGDDEEKALKTLGKPDQHTGFVIGYKGDGALLKLDLEPKEKTVLSVKLFVDES